MRWFKHMTSSYDDQKLAAVLDELGMEGYGFWWRILEVVARQLDENAEPVCEYSAKKWGEFFGFSARKFEKFARIFQKFGIFSMEFCGNSEKICGNSEKISKNLIRISIPNLLKYRDEYTERRARKSGECRDKIPPSRARVKETDTDTEIKESSLRSDSCAEQSCDSSTHRLPLPETQFLHMPQQSQAVVGLPLNTGKIFTVTPADADHWQELYPAVDVRQELRNMLGWLEANPRKRKTANGIKGFITRWLGDKQNRGGTSARASPLPPNPAPGKIFSNFEDDRLARMLAEAERRDAMRAGEN